jgi:hypothetical protein
MDEAGLLPLMEDLRGRQTEAAELLAMGLVDMVIGMIPIAGEAHIASALGSAFTRVASSKVGRAVTRVVETVRGAGRAALNRVRSVTDDAVTRVRELRHERLRRSISGFEDGTPHERKIAEEYKLSGRNVEEIRGENVEAPDLVIDGLSWEIKEITGTGRRTLQQTIRSAKHNFSTQGATDIGLARSDTRAIIDVRNSPLRPSNGETWNNPDRIRTELNRLEQNGTLNDVSELEILTSYGTIRWVR